jgi:hypothetical protein
VRKKRKSKKKIITHGGHREGGRGGEGYKPNVSNVLLFFSWSTADENVRIALAARHLA